MVRVFYQKNVFNKIALFFSCIIIILLFTFPGKVYGQSSDATLSTLSASSGALSPVFNSATTAYSLPDVPSGVTTVNITATPNDPNAISVAILANGANATDFTKVPLVFGLNALSIIVTAQDGSTLTYSINVNRLKSSDATLSGLTVSSGALSPTFNSATTTYSLPDVPSTTSTINITATQNDPNAIGVAIMANGANVTDFTKVPLAYLANTIKVTVTAQDGSTQNYTINVNRLKSTDATLSGLTVSSGALSPTFNSATTTYTLPDVPSTTSTINITPTTTDANATGITISANGASVTDFTKVPLAYLANTIKVTVTAQDGSTTQTYTINVNRLKSTDATLSGLTASNGSLSPSFISTTTTYNLPDVPSTTSTINITPTTNDPNATGVTVNGVNVTNGLPYTLNSLAFGPNAILVKVTAQDGSTTQTYTINVNRLKSSDATLSGLTSSSGSLSPTFLSNITTYNLPDVPSTTSTINITPTTNDPNATGVTVNGVAATSGTPYTVNSLSFGANAILVKVTAQDGSTTQTYTINVNRLKSSDATLSGLTASSGSLSPAFLSTTTTYNLPDVLSNISSITITPTIHDPNATGITINGVTAISGSPFTLNSLLFGANAILVKVTAQDGSTTQTYTINVNRLKSSDATLSNLIFSSGLISPTFVSATTNYSLNLSSSTSSINITPTINDPNATGVTINGNPATSGSPYTLSSLVFGTNTIQVIVTAQDGSTQTYTINAIRPKSTDATLSGLTSSSGALNPVFAATTTTYTTPDVLSTTSSINITPTVNDLNATGVTITANGVNVTDFTNTPLAFGTNAILIKVTAQDGSTTQTYTISVNRPKSSDATLSSLAASSGALSPAFLSTTTTYTAPDVLSTTNSITITPTVNDPNASGVTVNGVAATSGSPFTVSSLAFGINAILIKVTAQDGGTVKTYTVNVNRPKSTDATLSILTASSGALSPAFLPTTTNYTTPDVLSTTNSITITPTVNDPNATGVTVNGVAATSGSPFTVSSLAFGVNAILVKVTAQDGSTSQTYTVNVNRPKSSDASLSSLTGSSGSLTPVFASTTYNYAISVSNATSSITLTPTVNNANATVTVNGTAVPSGSASQAISLTAGQPLAISVGVTAQDGSTQTYTVTVTRSASSVSTLSALTVVSQTLSPTFNSGTNNYTVNVSHTTSTIQVSATTSDVNATISINGTNIASGATSAAIPINFSPAVNNITIVVTAQNGSTNTYNINVIRPQSSDANLSNLTTSNGTLTPVFATGTTAYALSLANSIPSITVTPTLEESNASIQVNGSAVNSGSPSQAIPLNVGSNTITVAVSSQDNSNTINYIINATRAGASNATLSGITLSNGTLSPAFSPTTTSYSASVASNVGSITVGATPADANATVSINGNNTQSTSINLNLGVNTITIVTLAQDGVTSSTTTLTVTRVPATVATLLSLTTNNGTLTPGFTSNTYNYSLTVGYPVSNIAITPTVTDNNATVKVNGNVVTSGNSSAPISLNVGANTITTIVTAQDGTTTQTYTLTVTRTGNSVSTLYSLALSVGTLTPTFGINTYNYTATVSGATQNIAITPIATDNNASIKVNNAVVASGSASGLIALNLGTNSINTVVTAQDGVTTSTYALIVTRQASTDASLSALTSSGGAISPGFSPTTYVYSQLVSNSVSSITINPTTNDGNATIRVNGTTQVSGVNSNAINLNVGSNVITVDVTAQDGVTKLSYTLNVTRQASATVTLSSLALSNGTLSPVFSSNTLVYTASVNNNISSITVTAQTTVANSILRINGNAVVSGTASPSIPLFTGNNQITVTVTSQDLSNTQTTTITVNRAPSIDASLNSLAISGGGVLTPGFSSGTYAYSATVSNSTSSITVTPSSTDANASITVNGNAVLSGTASTAQALNVGPNLITVYVLADDGIHYQNYTLTVTRLASSDAYLSNLLTNQGALTPGFTQTNTNYSINVGYSIQNITITPTADNLNATIQVNGVNTNSNSITSPITLNVGLNNIVITVTAQDGTTKLTYTIAVTKSASSDANLSNLTTDVGTWTPGFLVGTTSYNVSVLNQNSIINITPVTEDNNATVRVNGNIVSSGAATPITLNVGTNAVTIVVTAQNGTTQTYSLTVTRPPSSDASLSNLVLNTGTSATISPNFTSGNTSYTALVDNTVNSVTVTPTSTDPNAIIKINAVRLLSGSTSQSISLNSGINYINISVQSQDRTTTQVYTIAVTRAASSIAILTNFTLTSSGNNITYTPVFNQTTYNYNASVPNANNSISITPTAQDASSIITINGNLVTTTNPTITVPLPNTGDNNISLIISSADGITTFTYNIDVYRLKSSLATLLTFSSSGGAYSPTFDSATLNYSQTVPFTTGSITITPQPTDALSTITVAGNPTANNTPSQAINLTAASVTNIPIVVTSQDGNYKQTYNLAVTEQGSPDATLSSLNILGNDGNTYVPTPTTNLSSGGNLNAAVPNNVQSVTLQATTNNAKANVTANGKNPSISIPINVGDNVISVVVTAQDGISTQTNTLTINRAPSTDATLSNLIVNQGAITPTFDKNTQGYNITVANSITTINVTPTATDPDAVIEVNGTGVLTGTASSNINLNVGDNTINVIVTASNGIAKLTYTVVVTRQPATDATLSGLALSNGVLITPTFSPTTFSYKANVLNKALPVTVTPTVNEPNATVTVNNNIVTSGQASGPITLNVGDNTINVVGTAQDGTHKQNYTIIVTEAASSDSLLSALTFDNGIPAAPFSPSSNMFTYSPADVANGVQYITFTPTTDEPNATIQINGTSVTNGSNYVNPTPLVVGVNTFTLIVTAQDGKGTLTYTVNITRAASSVNTLSGLKVVDQYNVQYPLTESPAQTFALTDLPNNVSTITIIPTTTDINASVKVNGVNQQSGISSSPISVNVGPNTIPVVVTAQDSKTYAYSVNINRLKSSISTLDNITITDNSQTSNNGNNIPIPAPGFATTTTTYNISVVNTVNSITFSPTLTDNTATIMVNGILTNNNSASQSINLNVGLTVISVMITAQNGTATSSYTFNVTRASSNIVTLKNILLSSGTVSPTFDSNITSYTALVDHTVNTITLTPVPTDITATITVNGNQVLANTPSAPISLNVGDNTLLTIVVAQDGIAKKTYIINVTRQANNDAGLSALAVTSGATSTPSLSNIPLTPPFTSSGTNYTAAVAFNISSVLVTPTLNDPNATMTLNGQVLTSGTQSWDIPLNVGTNTLTAIVTAQDGTTINTYTITITRTGASVATLASIRVDNNTIPLNQTFSPSIYNYSVNVDNSNTTVTLKARLTDPNSTETIGGTPIPYNTYSNPISLNVGNNYITIKTLAQDGQTALIYTVNVIRAGSINNLLNNLSLNSGNIGAFSPLLNTYNAEVANSVSSINVAATVADSSATLTINGNLMQLNANTGSFNVPLSVGTNIINVLVTSQSGLQNTYTINVTRDAGIDASLSNIVINQGTLTPPFSPLVYNYNVEIPFLTTSITVTPTVNDPNATVSVNQESVNSGASKQIALSVGSNIIKVTGTAQDLSTLQDYVITVTRDAGSAIDSLSDLKLSSGTLSPVFATSTLNYVVNLPLETQSITLTPTLSDPTSTYAFRFKGNIYNQITSFQLDAGENTIDIIVTAQNGSSTNIYSVIVNRLPSVISTLSNLTVSNGLVLNPTFDGTNIFNYTAKASYDTQVISITPTLTDTKGSITVNGKTATSGVPFTGIPLIVGYNTITVVGTAQDGIATSTYNITVKRGPSADATLSAIMLDGTAITGFSPQNTIYKVSLNNSSTSVSVSAVTTKDSSFYTVSSLNGKSFIAGSGYGINLSLDTTYVTFLVTAPDSVTTKTYTLEIVRPLETQAIVFPPIPNQTYGDSPFDPGATITSGLPIIYSSSDTTVAKPGPNGKIIIIESGTTTITASVSDNLNYTHVDAVKQVLVINKANQVISGYKYPAIVKDSTYSITDIKTSATGLKVLFKFSDTSIVNYASKDSSYLKAYQLGQVTITAYQPGNKNYNAAPPLAYTINVSDPGGPDLVVHQAITPNGDGINDVLNIEGITNFTNTSVTIVNPYGIKVYYEKNYDNVTRVFDGHSNLTGQFLPSGTYFYFIKYSSGSTNKQLTGYIVLKY